MRSICTAIIVGAVCVVLPYAGSTAYAQPAGELLAEEVFLKGREADDVFFGDWIDVKIGTDGRTFVMDGQQNRIVTFDERGEVVTTLGRKGRGPGEFVVLSTGFPLGETIFVHDPGQSRIKTIHIETGEELQTVPVEATPTGKYQRGFAGTTGERHLLKFIKFLSQPNPEPEPNEYRWVEADGRMSDPVVEMPSKEIYRKVTPTSLITGPLPFARRPIVRTGADGSIYAAWTGELSVAVYSPEGENVRTIQTEVPTIRVTEADLNRKEEQFETAAMKQGFRQRFNSQSAQTWPAINGLLVDGDRVWVEVVDRNHEEDTWWALNHQSEKVAEFSVPASVRLTDIDGDVAVGVYRSEAGALLAVRYELRTHHTP